MLAGHSLWCSDMVPSGWPCANQMPLALSSLKREVCYVYCLKEMPPSCQLPAEGPGELALSLVCASKGATCQSPGCMSQSQRPKKQDVQCVWDSKDMTLKAALGAREVSCYGMIHSNIPTT